jgi:hypothetical protein
MAAIFIAPPPSMEGRHVSFRRHIGAEKISIGSVDILRLRS